MYNRLLSLDVFRGLTIALMIIVNSPGNQTSYSWIEHSPWNGCTLADLVFPFFILILGMSACFSLHYSRAKGIAVNKLITKIVKRTLMLFAIGLLLNAFPNHFDYSTIRIFGVLQRLAICYFVAAILYLTTSIKQQAIILVVLLVLYWLVMTVIPVPHFGIPNLSPDGNLAAYLDQILFSPQHLYAPSYDPEGFLSTFPSLATALMGNLTTFWLLSSHTKQHKLTVIGLTGGTAALLGWLWGLTFPINKTLWSSSYVLWTGGLGLLLFGIVYWLIEIKEWRKWSKPFIIFGTNALIVYFLHVLFLKIQAMIPIRGELGKVVTLKLYLTQQLFTFGNLSLKESSLFYAVGYMFFWLAILGLIYPKKRLNNAIGPNSNSSVIR